MLFTLLVSLTAFAPLAHSAPAPITTGLNDSDTIVFSMINTRSKSLAADPIVPPALCMIAQKNDESSKEAPSFKNPRDHVVTAGEGPCDYLTFLTPQIEMVRTYPAASMKAGFWHEIKDNPAPQQFTFDTDFKGQEINEAFARLQKKCRDQGATCDSFSLLFVHGQGGLFYRFPLKEFKVTPDAKSVKYDPRDSSFEIDNFSIRVVPQAK